MATYEVIAGVHGIDGKLLRVGARFKKGTGFEVCEHFSRCFKKVDTDLEKKIAAKEAKGAKLAAKEAKQLAEAGANRLAEAEAAGALAAIELAKMETTKAEEAKQLAEAEVAKVAELEADQLKREAEALELQLDALDWNKLKDLPFNSPEVRKYLKTVNGKRFLKTAYGKELIAVNAK
jgi:hypothetical protein